MKNSMYGYVVNQWGERTSPVLRSETGNGSEFLLEPGEIWYQMDFEEWQNDAIPNMVTTE